MIRPVDADGADEASGDAAGVVDSVLQPANKLSLIHIWTVVKPSNFYEILTYSMDNTDPVTYTLKRGDETLEKTVTPVYNEQEQSWLVGIKIPPATQVKTTLLNSGYYGAQYMGPVSYTHLDVYKRQGRGAAGV